MPLSDKVRLQHILEAIEYVEQFLEGRSNVDLYDNPQLRFAIERQLEIIGEATNNLSDSIKNKYTGIEWRKIVAFRNFVVHEYFGVDLELVWLITQKNLPPLKQIITQMLIEIN
jgi:uncharacterized protein with HEPN domain